MTVLQEPLKCLRECECIIIIIIKAGRSSLVTFFEKTAECSTVLTVIILTRGVAIYTSIDDNQGIDIVKRMIISCE